MPELPPARPSKPAEGTPCWPTKIFLPSPHLLGTLAWMPSTAATFTSSFFGARAGFIAPSGKPVVEEEYERATAQGLPTIALIQEGVEYEPEAERLVRRVSDFVGGRFRATFSSLEELKANVTNAIRQALEHLQQPEMDPTIIEEKLRKSPSDSNEPFLRTAFAPIRDEEVIDVVALGGAEFREQIVAIGMAKEVRLLSAWSAKGSRLQGDCLPASRTLKKGCRRDAAMVRFRGRRG